MCFQDALLLFQYNQIYLIESLYNVIVNSDVFNNWLAKFIDGRLCYFLLAIIIKGAMDIFICLSLQTTDIGFEVFYKLVART